MSWLGFLLGVRGAIWTLLAVKETFIVHVSHTHTEGFLTWQQSIFFLFPWADLADHFSVIQLNSSSSLWACCCIMTSSANAAPVYSISFCLRHHWLINLMTSKGIVAATILQAASGFLYRKTDLLILEIANYTFHTLPKRCVISQFRIVLSLIDENWKSSQGCTVFHSVMNCC